jgi:hypothetical protein
MIKLNLKNNLAAQDMISIVMKEKGLSTIEAIEFSINHEIHQKILNKGYASIALDLWGHGGPDRKWDVLNEPIIELELDNLRERLIADIVEKQRVDTETAICYFLIFTMDFLGYHI